MSTLAALWSRALAQAPATPAFLAQEAGAWREVGWEEAGRSVDELAAGFLTLGIGPGERVAILSRTRLEWTLCDWALIAIGALPVPLYPTSSALECSYVLGNCGARMVVCEDAEQEAKVAPVRRELEALERLILIDGDGGPETLRLAELRARGRALLAAKPHALEGVRSEIGEDDPLTIVYTSGTTGPPKGCLLTNRNYASMVEMVRRVEGLIEPGDRVLLHLPLAHTFARLVEFLGAAAHMTIGFCPDAAGIPRALREVRPTILPSVPRLYEKLAAAIRAGIGERRAPGRALARWALDAGARAGACREQGLRLPPRLAVELAVADRLVLGRVRARLGGSLRVAISGGAPLGEELARFFLSLGLPLLEGYGLTECTTAATLNRPGRFRLGSAGPALEGVELRLARDGEIELRGENVFACYYRDEEATRAAFTEDGWLRTGDLGALDADGFLTITDRKKEIVVLSSGRNLSPRNAEAALEASPYIAQACVVGDRRPYLAALLALDDDALARDARDEEEALALVERAVAEANRSRSRDERVRRFAVVPRPFSEEAGELTPTLKLRRRVCEQHYRAEIEQLYAGR
ncbi:MAG TPA: long-chain fatty acid--CoA ligase [Gaiellaceae bacterium]|nr:long-chain fatty acid--CoA ligase [Gaiellaceae bacterium]